MITARQAEALFVARKFGNVRYLHSTAPFSGSFKRMMRALKGRTMIDLNGSITLKGEAALEEWQDAHPRTKLRPQIRGIDAAQ